MDKIINTNEAIKISENVHSQGKAIVLVGGCFDILHVGHITFLEKAKAAGDTLFVFLESDESIRKMKGESRPINNQEDRAKILAALQVVDFVIALPPDLKDENYDDMILKIKPDIIAITQGDTEKNHKDRQAAKTNCQIIEVTEFISDQSTSRLVKLLGKDV